MAMLIPGHGTATIWQTAGRIGRRTGLTARRHTPNRRRRVVPLMLMLELYFRNHHLLLQLMLSLRLRRRLPVLQLIIPVNAHVRLPAVLVMPLLIELHNVKHAWQGTQGNSH